MPIKHSSYFEIPEYLEISNNRLLIRPAFEEYSTGRKKTMSQCQNEKNLRENFPSGLVTRKIKAKMVKIIDSWISSLKYTGECDKGFRKEMPTFVTLTLPSKQMHDDKYLNANALNPFIKTMKRRFGIKYYLWRAERQKNGNIHYHILADKYIKHIEVKNAWNKLISKLGYIESYRKNQIEYHKKGFKCNEKLINTWSRENQLKAYIKGTKENWTNPNTTDIHSLKNIKNATAYICKYVSKCDEYNCKKWLEEKLLKNEISEIDYNIEIEKLNIEIQKNKINSRVWGCSDELKSLSFPKIVVDSTVTNFIDDVIEKASTKVIDCEMYKLIYIKDLTPVLVKYPLIKNLIEDHYKTQYKALYSTLQELIFERNIEPDIQPVIIPEYKLEFDF